MTRPGGRLLHDLEQVTLVVTEEVDEPAYRRLLVVGIRLVVEALFAVRQHVAPGGDLEPRIRCRVADFGRELLFARREVHVSIMRLCPDAKSSPRSQSPP